MGWHRDTGSAGWNRDIGWHRDMGCEGWHKDMGWHRDTEGLRWHRDMEYAAWHRATRSGTGVWDTPNGFGGTGGGSRSWSTRSDTGPWGGTEPWGTGGGSVGTGGDSGDIGSAQGDNPLSPQAVGISVEFVSHITCAFARSCQPTRVARATEATVTMGSKVGTGNSGGPQTRSGWEVARRDAVPSRADVTDVTRRWWRAWP